MKNHFKGVEYYDSQNNSFYERYRWSILRLKDIVKETPLQLDHYLSQKYDCKVYLKREDLQWVRSFKLRGAYNAISVLSDEAKSKGITCASAGNHAQGVAYTAKNLI